MGEISIRLTNVHFKKQYYLLKQYYESVINRKLTHTEFVALVVYVASLVTKQSIILEEFHKVVLDDLLAVMKNPLIFYDFAVNPCSRKRTKNK